MNYNSIASEGRYGELVKQWGSGTTNPKTGLQEFYTGTNAPEGDPQNYNDDGTSTDPKTFGPFKVTEEEYNISKGIATTGIESLEDQFTFMFGVEGDEDNRGYLYEVNELEKEKIQASKDKITAGYGKIGIQEDVVNQAETFGRENIQISETKNLRNVGLNSQSTLMNMNQQESQQQSVSGFASSTSGAQNVAKKNMFRSTKGQLEDIGKTSGTARSNLTETTASKLSALGFDRDLLKSSSDLIDTNERENIMAYDKSRFDTLSTIQGAYDQITGAFSTTTGFGSEQVANEGWNAATGSWEEVTPSLWEGYDYNQNDTDYGFGF